MVGFHLCRGIKSPPPHLPPTPRDSNEDTCLPWEKDDSEERRDGHGAGSEGHAQWEK